MKNNPEEIPAIIFDWIESSAFTQLSIDEKKLVLEFLTEEEYNQMRETSNAIRKTKKVDESPRKKKLKDELLSKFAETNEGSKPGDVTLKNLYVWKSIAAMLFAAVLFSGFFLVKKHNTIESAIGKNSDTVYVTKEVTKSVEKHDTVYLYRNVYHKQSQHQSQLPDMIVPDYNENDLVYPDDINTVPFTDIKNVNHEPRGNSMKYDTIDRLFRFSTF